MRRPAGGADQAGEHGQALRRGLAATPEGNGKPDPDKFRT